MLRAVQVLAIALRDSQMKAMHLSALLRGTEGYLCTLPERPRQRILTNRQTRQPLATLGPDPERDEDPDWACHPRPIRNRPLGNTAGHDLGKEFKSVRLPRRDSCLQPRRSKQTLTLEKNLHMETNQLGSNPRLQRVANQRLRSSLSGLAARLPVDRSGGGKQAQIRTREQKAVVVVAGRACQIGLEASAGPNSGVRPCR